MFFRHRIQIAVFIANPNAYTLLQEVEEIYIYALKSPEQWRQEKTENPCCSGMYIRSALERQHS